MHLVAYRSRPAPSLRLPVCTYPCTAVTGPRALKGNSAEAYEHFYKLVLESVCVEASMEMAVQDPAANAEVRYGGRWKPALCPLDGRPT